LISPSKFLAEILTHERPCWQFFDGCATHGLELTTVRPFHVAAWIEDFPGSKPTVKQKLAAVRMSYHRSVRQLVDAQRNFAVEHLGFGSAWHVLGVASIDYPNFKAYCSKTS
jgi:hypothetical protein